jgi:hypothetical protein
MADTKLSGLTSLATVLGTIEVYVNDGGVSKKATIDQLKGYIALASPTQGRVVFGGASSTLTESAKFTWDDTNRILALGSSASINTIQAANNTTSGTGGRLDILSGTGFGTAGSSGAINLKTPDGGTASGNGGNLNIKAGDGGSTGGGGFISISAGTTGASSTGNDGGWLSLFAGASPAGVGGIFEMRGGDGLSGGACLFYGGTGSGGTGGSIRLRPGAGTTTNGFVEIMNPVNFIKVLLDPYTVATSNKTFTFPNTSGIFAVTDGAGKLTAKGIDVDYDTGSSTATINLLAVGGGSAGLISAYAYGGMTIGSDGGIFLGDSNGFPLWSTITSSGLSILYTIPLLWANLGVTAADTGIARTGAAALKVTDGSTGYGTLTVSSIIRNGGTSSQFLKADGSTDSNTYVTGNQTITLSGDISGSGTTAITTTIGAGKVTFAMVNTAAWSDDTTLASDSSTLFATQHAIKTYVDTSITGLKFKRDVRVASTANVTVSNPATAVFDGVTLSSGDRILLKNQSTASENGVYVFNTSGTALTRATDGDTGAELISATFPVREGTVNQDTWWTITNDTITLGSTAIVFTQTAGAGTYVAGSGLTLTGNSFAITSGGVTNTMLAGSITASKLVGSDIATVGTISAGTWQGTVVGSTYGGTGINNAGRTLTINTNSGTLTFTNSSTTLTVANTGSVSGTNTGDQTITLSGDISGSGTGAITTTLPTVNSNTGTFNNVTVNGKGLVTAASNVSYLTSYSETSTLANVTARGNTSSDGILLTENGNLSTSYAIKLKRNTDTSSVGFFIQARNAADNATLFSTDTAGNVTAASLIKSGGTAAQFLKADGSVDSSTYLTANQTITLSGDVSGSGTTAITTAIGANKVTLGMLATLAANSVIANVTGSTATPTAVSLVSTATASSVLLRDSNINAFANNFLSNYVAVTTAAGTTTLTVSSARLQTFTGSSTQTVVLPAVSTLALGHVFEIYNFSSGNVTVQSSGGNAIQVMAANSHLIVVSNATTGTGATVWNSRYIPILTNVENTAISTWAGSTSITSVGTIGTGTWQGTVVGSTYGGTGINNAGRTLTISTNSGTISFTGASTTLTVANTGSISGTNTGDQTITLTGDVTGSGTGSFAASIGSNRVTLGMLATLAANSVIGNSTGSTATPTAVSMLSTSTASSIALRDGNANLFADNVITGYATTVTAAGTTTLTVDSVKQQFFTGTTTQTVTLPVASTLTLGHSFFIYNDSTGVVTVQSSGADPVKAMAATSRLRVTCILTSGTTAASWGVFYVGPSGGGGGITNSAGNNVIMKSDGTNAVASSLTDDGTTVKLAASVFLGTAYDSSKIGFHEDTTQHAIRFTPQGAGSYFKTFENSTTDMYFQFVPNGGKTVLDSYIGSLQLGVSGANGLFIDGSSNISLGGHTNGSAKLHIIATTQQIRWGYDTTNYSQSTVASNGAVTFDAAGAGASYTFGKDVTVPNIAYANSWTGVNKAPTQNAVYDAVTPVSVVNSTATYNDTVTFGRKAVMHSASGGSITHNLPTAVGNKAWITVIKTDSSTNTVTVDGSGSETIVGGLTAILTKQYESITLVSDNANWFII